MGLTSSGLLLYRFVDKGTGEIELLLGHMGGPLFAHKKTHSWSIPKGLAEPGEDDLLAVAEREFTEELGSPPPPGDTIELGTGRSGNKTLVMFAREGNFDPSTFHSNTFELEWPRGSGTMQTFPEMDAAEWISPARARELLAKSQVSFVDRLIDALAERG